MHMDGANPYSQSKYFALVEYRETQAFYGHWKNIMFEDGKFREMN